METWNILVEIFDLLGYMRVLFGIWRLWELENWGWFLGGASIVKWTTLDPCTCLGECDSNTRTKTRICNEGG